MTPFFQRIVVTMYPLLPNITETTRNHLMELLLSHNTG